VHLERKSPMRLLVTGASGHIGSAVCPDLLAAGHTVVGLARSDASATTLTAAGVEVLRGSLDDLDGLRAAATDADGVIHLAFKHELTYAGEFARAAESDLRAVEAIGAALEGSDKPFVITSGTALLAMAVPGRLGLETTVLERGPRVDSENTVVAMAARGVRSSVVRLPPTVHSSLDRHGFVPTLIAMARKNGVSVYIGDGANRWPAVHTLDAARLYRLAVESAPAGARLHGVGEQGVPFRQIAEAIGRGLGLPAASVTPDEAAKYLGFLATFAQVDNPSSGAATRALLQWEPAHAGLLADLEERHYFEPSQTPQ
jgi:nucleoside-diphosphate-sugar epimerase